MLEDILILATGIFCGIFFTLFWQTIQGRWRRSQSLRLSSAKVRKENADRAKKASADARLARSTAFRSFLEGLMFFAAILLITWLVWILFV